MTSDDEKLRPPRRLVVTHFANGKNETGNFGSENCLGAEKPSKGG